MYPSIHSLLAVALLMSSAALAAPTPGPNYKIATLASREPHFAEIAAPESGATLYYPVDEEQGQTGSLDFKFVDGEQTGDNSIVVTLHGDTASVTLLGKTSFDGEYGITETLNVPFDEITPGDYTLTVTEYDEDDSQIAQLSQPLYVNEMAEGTARQPLDEATETSATSEPEARAPHPFAIVSPSSGYTLDLSSGNDTFTLKVSDGEQYSEYYVQASLQSDACGSTKSIVGRTLFDGYYVEKSVTLEKADFPAGAYKLVVAESDADGKVVATLTQDFTIQ